MVFLHRMNSSMKEHNRYSIVETTLSLERANQTSWNTDRFGNGLNSNGIRRRNCGTERQGDSDRHSGNPPQGNTGNSERRCRSEKHRIEENGFPAAPECTPGELHADSPQQRWQEDRQNNIAVDFNMGSIGR